MCPDEKRHPCLSSIPVLIIDHTLLRSLCQTWGVFFPPLLVDNIVYFKYNCNFNTFFSSYQNLAEAEYAVALYMYMRLLGYPADRISILTTYNGQKHLIRDVINQRCAGNPFFSQPNKVRTRPCQSIITFNDCFTVVFLYEVLLL